MPARRLFHGGFGGTKVWEPLHDCRAVSIFSRSPARARWCGPEVRARAMRAARPAVPDSPLELGSINLAVAGEIECGDTWRVADGGSRVSLLVADGLGHGPLAATAAQAAAQVFCARPFDAPSMTLRNCHGRLGGHSRCRCGLRAVAGRRIAGGLCWRGKYSRRGRHPGPLARHGLARWNAGSAAACAPCNSNTSGRWAAAW